MMIVTFKDNLLDLAKAHPWHILLTFKLEHERLK